MSVNFSPEIVLYGYRVGIFPMADPDGRIYWYRPDPRCIFEIGGLRISRSLRQTLRRGTFEIRVNSAFVEVMHACGDRSEGTWISPQIVEVYGELHRRGFAHSVESWRDGRLVGGLYGVTQGGAFFGESMFYRARDASKVALVALMGRLEARGYALLDTQWSTPHLSRLGAIEIPGAEYARRLREALELSCTFVD